MIISIKRLIFDRAIHEAQFEEDLKELDTTLEFIEEFGLDAAMMVSSEEFIKLGNCGGLDFYYLYPKAPGQQIGLHFCYDQTNCVLVEICLFLIGNLTEVLEPNREQYHNEVLSDNIISIKEHRKYPLRELKTGKHHGKEKFHYIPGGWKDEFTGRFKWKLPI